MGQKINPTGFRLPVTRNWTSRWYANGRDYPNTLQEDLKVRSFLLKKLRNASVARVLIERPANNARITIFTSRPGIVIGKQAFSGCQKLQKVTFGMFVDKDKQGADIEALKTEVQKMMGVPVHVNIEEVRRPELDAQLIADGITQQLEKRVMFRRAMKRAMQNAMRLGALGIKVQSSGRLNGADIARDEWYREGRVPLQTLRANIDYAIVISSWYNELKAEMSRREAIVQALNLSFPTVLTSGSILSSAGFLIAQITTEPAIVGIGECLCRGTLISMFLVMFILPQILFLGDGIVERTRFDLKVPEVARSAHGTVYVNGRVRGRISGVVDAQIQGVIYGDVSGMLETGAYQKEEEPAHETEDS